MTATEWFDQFLSELAKRPEIQGNDQWCARHWAPCPILGANGLKAAMELIGDWAAQQPSSDPAFLNNAMAKSRLLCCKLGDEQMYIIWGKCPPVGSDA